MHRLTQEVPARRAKIALPCFIDAEVAAVSILEKNGIGQSLDQFLRPALCLEQLRFAAAQVLGDARGERERAPAHARKRTHQPEQQQADYGPAQHHRRRQPAIGEGNKLRACFEPQLPSAPAHLQAGCAGHRLKLARSRGNGFGRCRQQAVAVEQQIHSRRRRAFLAVRKTGVMDAQVYRPQKPLAEYAAHQVVQDKHRGDDAGER